MYVKQENISQIIQAAREIKRLSTLETCGLSAKAKEEMLSTGWIEWFAIEADKIYEALNYQPGLYE